ncbi:Uu.00g079710.m01.CDS01 [Anthostomella pinea]|uniref:chitinase n=1 Tax=Anthostomella pinea TaxID=933095 RepID=A0AAI8VKU9_9PEZI|nr:Uu.00g079710.m01.CDS01 [Anthostomella pinea]
MRLTHGLIGLLAGLTAAGTISTTQMRNVVYFDQYHTAIVPGKDITAGITHVIMTFANSSLFAPTTSGPYTPFMPVPSVRAHFDSGAKVGIAIGGWGDTAGFSAGAASAETRHTYAANVASMAAEHGFDFVDVDWEYPGGNGEDYRQTPNADKTTEITTFPLLLKEIKAAIAPRALSIAVPGLERDMIAYTPEQAPQIFASVDMVNVMAYDLMNRRDVVTKHHSSVSGSLDSVRRYTALGLDASKINLGLAYYAKYFQTPANASACTTGTGCPIVPAENADGSDAGTSGTVTFERQVSVPGNLTTSTDESCGTGTFFTCAGLAGKGCCSQYGYCGATTAHCGAGCQNGYGTCSGADIQTSYQTAMERGVLDQREGGMWYWDAEANLFWTWDTVELMQRKFVEIVAPLGLGGVMAWSLGEDSADWSHILAVSQAVREKGSPLMIAGRHAREVHRRAMRPGRYQMRHEHVREVSVGEL